MFAASGNGPVIPLQSNLDLFLQGRPSDSLIAFCGKISEGVDACCFDLPFNRFFSSYDPPAKGFHILFKIILYLPSNHTSVLSPILSNSRILDPCI